MSLTYAIVGRPGAVRPILGDTVTLTCEVEGAVMSWISPLVDDNRNLFTNDPPLNIPRGDTRSGK